MSTPFFSHEWRDGAMAACNASEAMCNGFKDPAAFTDRMAFGVTGRDDLATHLDWTKLRSCRGLRRSSLTRTLWLVIKADIETWKKAAKGVSEGGKLLMAGKIKFVKGPVLAAIENAAAFNNPLLSWGKAAPEVDYNV